MEAAYAIDGEKSIESQHAYGRAQTPLSSPNETFLARLRGRGQK
jgi:hypothetical protein